MGLLVKKGHNLNDVKEWYWYFGIITKEVDVIEIIASILGLAIGIIVGYFVRKNISETKIGEAKALANDIIDKANKDSETIKKEKLLEAKEEIHKWRTDAEKEQRESMTIKFIIVVIRYKV